MNCITETHWSGCDAEITIPPRRPDVVEEVMEGEAILFDPVTGCTHRFNETALAVWRLCDGTATTADMARRLTEHYDIDLDTALDHVEQIVTVLADSQLLIPEPIRWS